MHGRSENSRDVARYAHIVELPLGDHHLTAAEYVAEASMLAIDVTALCGHRWTPGSSHGGLPACPSCIKVAESQADVLSTQVDLRGPTLTAAGIRSIVNELLSSAMGGLSDAAQADVARRWAGEDLGQALHVIRLLLESTTEVDPAVVAAARRVLLASVASIAIEQGECLRR